MSSSDVYEQDDDDELSDTPSIVPRAARGTGSRALKQLRSSLPEDSVKLYTEHFHRTFQDKPDNKEDNFNTTQDGIVIWTPHEKRSLFELLDRKGLNGIREIAAVITTKSELEIQEYVKLLQKGVRRQNLNDGHSRTTILGDIPAAAEISEECCKLLDNHAELLSLEEQKEEATAGSLKHQGLWIINSEVAESLELEVVASESVRDESAQEFAAQVNEEQGEQLVTTPDVNSAAAFFKTPKWILLSERLFMNFGGRKLQDNWTNVAFEGESPSMTADVLTEFYEIALNVTRRLVHATHFFASSRVRKHSRASRPLATAVRASDVRSAAHTLNMKSNSSEFWIGVARRCNLDVQDERHRKGWSRVFLDHDEVESLLSQEELPQEPYERITPVQSPRERSSSIASDSLLDPLDDVSTDSEDEHAEAIDQQHSAAEELLCWSTLGQKPPASSNCRMLFDQKPPRPRGKRKTAEELVDWRDRTLYRSEWEEFGYETEKLEDAFEGQRKRLRLMASDSFRPLSGASARNEYSSSEPISDSNSDSGAGADTNANAAADTGGRSPPTEPQPNLSEIEFQTDESDPEFRPQFPQPESRTKVKPKKAPSRTSSRKRTPVSYAPPEMFDFDFEVDTGMEMEVDTPMEQDHDEGHTEDNHQKEDSASSDGEVEDDDHGS
ncbi:uncharacterized protein BDV17DRAFT_267342 [Aspergillus undulatus]|uniref:uncharacterized protein n=1 Tax=Aspergillus undulatus TaxID=1810928 RepID=UPI003CCDCEF2